MTITDSRNDIEMLTPEDFSSVFGEPISDRLRDFIARLNLRYIRLKPEERDECIKTAIKILLDPAIDESGEHRLGKWERGWEGNLEALKERGEDGLLPVYFSVARDLTRWSKWRQEYIKPFEAGFDYKILSVILEWLFEKYASEADAVYEFGCGTGHHLLRLRNINKTAALYGLDWAEASQKILAEMAAKGIVSNIHGKKFDFFNPDESLVLANGAVVYTVGALEQVGARHEKFIDYLIKNRPKVCFHVEPIGEMLDDAHLVDFLAKAYYQKRNYLSGFVARLKELERQGKVTIRDLRRTYLGGSLLTEYVVAVWSPVI